MRNVVRGVRNSCVTAETNAARRSLSAITPLSNMATAAAPNSSELQATTNDIRTGVSVAPSASGSAPSSSRTGSTADRLLASSPVGAVTAESFASGKRSLIASSVCFWIAGQSSKQP